MTRADLEPLKADAARRRRAGAMPTVTNEQRAQKILRRYVRTRRISEGHLLMAFIILSNGTADLPGRLLGAYRLARKFSLPAGE